MILDTNVLSALMRTPPEAVVVAWLDRQSADAIWITTITLFETRLGLSLLPDGRPVSYTHLDVYKRQISGRLCRWRP